MTLRDRGITDPTRWAKENGVEMVHPYEKHRYFQFVGDRRQRREMRSKLNYPVVDAYPKAPSARYDDGPILTIRHEPVPEPENESGGILGLFGV